MVFFKRVEVRDLRDKYGGSQRGLFALERIAKGEKIWYCECGDKDGSFTRTQLLDIIKKWPKLDYFVRSFSYMIDDDLYAMPHTYMEEKNNDECALFNHSCEPNCGFVDDGFGDNVVCVRDIEPGDELTYHYGLLETEASLILDIKCKCNVPTCCGRLSFDFYRDETFVQRFFPYMTPYLKQKVLDMKHRWYSSDCYVRRYPKRIDSTLCVSPSSSTTSNSNGSSSSSSSDSEESGDDEVVDIEVWEKGLCALRDIKRGQLVAKFADECSLENIRPEAHFLRHSTKPNCVLVGREVFANVDVPEDSELTIYYHGILL